MDKNIFKLALRHLNIEDFEYWITWIFQVFFFFFCFFRPSFELDWSSNFRSIQDKYRIFHKYSPVKFFRRVKNNNNHSMVVKCIYERKASVSTKTVLFVIFWYFIPSNVSMTVKFQHIDLDVIHGMLANNIN